MNDSISMVAASVQNDLQRLNSIANNAANALTPGFKREFLVKLGELNAFDRSVQAIQPPLLSAFMDTKLGIQKSTGNPLDIALASPGFFEVTGNQGNLYTRQGSFRLDDKGRLVTQEGYPVSGVNGDIYLTSSNPLIDATGQITDQGKVVDKIKIVNFQNLQSLTKLGGGYFLPTSESLSDDVESPKIFQGHLESSNVDSAHEMVSLMEVYRHFETSHKVIQAYDDLNDKVLRNLNQF